MSETGPGPLNVCRCGHTMGDHPSWPRRRPLWPKAPDYGLGACCREGCDCERYHEVERAAA